MASFFHMSVKMVSRSEGRSAVACAAYRSGQALQDDFYGKTHDYGRRNGIMSTGLTAPAHAPVWCADREQLWNRVEASERRKDAQLAREFVLGLPHQLGADENARLVHQFITDHLIDKGVVADWAIHAPNREGDERNWHAHIMTTTRTVAAEGFSSKKDRSLNTNEQLLEWREAWANILNQAYEKFNVRGEDGEIARVDHRSFEKRGIRREPTVHMGVHATQMERRGEETEIGELNRMIAANNNAPATRRVAEAMTREALMQQLKSIEREKLRGPENEPGFEP